jgi:hypothetical protein
MCDALQYIAKLICYVSHIMTSEYLWEGGMMFFKNIKNIDVYVIKLILCIIINYNNMESTALYYNDDDEYHHRSLPGLDREAIQMDLYHQLKAVVSLNKAMKLANHPDSLYWIPCQYGRDRCLSSLAHSPARKTSSMGTIPSELLIHTQIAKNTRRCRECNG